MAALIGALDTYTSRQIGENGNIEYCWSNNIRERIAQLSFQLTRTKDISYLAKQTEGILMDLKARNASGKLLKEEYVEYMQKGNVFLSCARSEGWNLPLIEAMACGTPAIYSNWGGQLEFADGKGIPVNIIGERPASDGQGLQYNRQANGNYCEPDFNDLKAKMRSAYENYEVHRQKALEDAKIIHKEFNWQKVAQIGAQRLNKIRQNLY